LGPAALNANADRAAALPAGVWTFSRGSESVRELTIFSDPLGISVSLLQFERGAHVPEFDEEQVWDTSDQFKAGQS
jgi:hypothetical protein